MRERRAEVREVFVPLEHPPGHAQADFGEAVAVVGGVERKIPFFCLDLPHLDAGFVKAYPAEQISQVRRVLGRAAAIQATVNSLER